MNNIDKLRNIIMKEQKLLHPYGQGVMGVVHAFNRNESNFRAEKTFEIESDESDNESKLNYIHFN